MTDEFKKVMKFIFDHENVMSKGKVVSENDSRDPGGLTKYGIDARSHPGVDIENLTEEQALDIYWQEWIGCKADRIPFPLSMAYFDTAVNSGKRQAVLLLQRAVGAKDDGMIGPNTIGAALTACALYGANEVALRLCSKKENFYNVLCLEKPQFACFKDGWLNRVSDLKSSIKTIC